MKKPAKTARLELRPLKLPPRITARLNNGLDVVVVKRGPLPLVSVRFVTFAGAAYDPPARHGLAELTARLMRRGAGGQTAEALNDAVDFVGASLNAWVGEDSVGVSITTPVAHFDAMLELMARVLQQPDFPENEVAIARRRTLAQLTNALDDPDDVADRALVSAVFGSHPYGHETIGSKVSVGAITRGEIARYHEERIAPDGAKVFVVGQIDPKVALAAVERAFGGWRSRPRDNALPAWSGLARAGDVLVVDKPEQTQAQVRITARGVARNHPDHFPLVAVSSVLGGSFTSRLMQQIRVKRGLTYGAGCHFDQLAAAGIFTVSSFTKTETVGELVEVALGEIARMKAKGPTPTELVTAQRYISGLYPSRLETNESIGSALAEAAMYGQGDDWVERYRERLAAVTVEQAAEAAARHLPADDRVIVLVGNASQLEKTGAAFGRTSVMPVAELE